MGQAAQQPQSEADKARASLEVADTKGDLKAVIEVLLKLSLHNSMLLRGLVGASFHTWPLPADSKLI